MLLSFESALNKATERHDLTLPSVDTAGWWKNWNTLKKIKRGLEILRHPTEIKSTHKVGAAVGFLVHFFSIFESKEFSGVTYFVFTAKHLFSTEKCAICFSTVTIEILQSQGMDLVMLVVPFSYIPLECQTSTIASCVNVLYTERRIYEGIEFPSHIPWMHASSKNWLVYRFKNIKIKGDTGWGWACEEVKWGVAG